MRLVSQTTLYFQEGTSDKVYEVDLCEVGEQQFVVNFRYGRRGSTLRDGTKTPAPVDRTQAEAIAQRLIDDKTRKGYQSVSESSAPAPAPAVEAAPVAEAAAPAALSPREAAIMERLTGGRSMRSKWKLSRAVWRAGELRLRAAADLVAGFLRESDAMLAYSAAWSLGRIGSSHHIHQLESLHTSNDSSPHLRRIASESVRLLTAPEAWADQQAQLIQQLPESLRAAHGTGDAEAVAAALRMLLEADDPRVAAVLEHIYLIDDALLRPALMTILGEVPMAPPWFQRVRHLYKYAELRDDGEMLGVIVHRCELASGLERMASYNASWNRQPKPTLGDQPRTALSKETRDYLVRRTWRTLQRRGEVGDDTYADLAAGILLALQPEDVEEPLRSVRYVHAPTANNRWHYEQVERWSLPLGRFWSTCHVLFGRSELHQATGNLTFAYAQGHQPGPDEGDSRIESYPDIWDRRPDALIRLLLGSQVEAVQRFAVRALRANPQACTAITTAQLVGLLSSPFAFTAELAYEQALGRYDRTQPDLGLLVALAHCALAPGRDRAIGWIQEQAQTFLADHAALLALLLGPQGDGRRAAALLLPRLAIDGARAREFGARLISAALMPEAEIPGDVIDAVAAHLGHVFDDLDPAVINDLLDAASLSAQRLGGELALAHRELGNAPPPGLISRLVGSEHAEIREIGVRLVGRLPDAVLKGSVPALIDFARHELPDIREAVRPLLKRLASTDEACARELTAGLIDALLVPGAAEGVPTHTTRILVDDLRDHLSWVPQDLVYRLLRSRSKPAQELGGVLLATNVDASTLPVSQLIDLTGHEILSIREAARGMLKQELHRLKAELEEAIRLLDVRWDDTREWAMSLFERELIVEGEVDPSILVAICDSVRADVQAFGRKLITVHFDDGAGTAYLSKLSEHPSVDLQLFASNYLERFAAGNPDMLRRLKPYFISVLSRVNRGGVAKQRVLRFLAQECRGSREAAEVVAAIAERQSATSLIGSKQELLAIMVDISRRHPDIPLPIAVKPLEVRGAV